jgi:hypothetical protein
MIKKSSLRYMLPKRQVVVNHGTSTDPMGKGPNGDNIPKRKYHNRKGPNGESISKGK